jgi:hypothetical protein
MLSLANIINIIVNLPSSSSTTQTNFALGLIFSANTVISSATRVKVYTSAAAMIADGFASNSAEVLAAQLYFSQSPAPSQLAVGMKAGGETAVQALTACRSANTQWYGCLFIGAVKADVVALAAYVESMSPAGVMFYTTADSDALAGTAGNVGLTLKASSYRRTIGQYSTSADAAAAILGYASGASSEAYDLMFQTEAGVTAEVLSDAQATVLTNENLNYFSTYQTGKTFFAHGVMASGAHFDDVIGIDELTANIQSAMINVLTSNPKVPLTDPGTQIITTAIASACNSAFTSGFLAAGAWQGSNILNLKAGDTLSNGYSIQAASVSSLTTTQKSNRAAPPIYVCVILAESLESFTITVNAQL